MSEVVEVVGTQRLFVCCDLGWCSSLWLFLGWFRSVVKSHNVLLGLVSQHTKSMTEKSRGTAAGWHGWALSFSVECWGSYFYHFICSLLSWVQLFNIGFQFFQSCTLIRFCAACSSMSCIFLNYSYIVLFFE